MIWGAHKTQCMAMRYQGSRDDPPPVVTFDEKEIVPTDTIETLGVLHNKGCIGYAQLEKVKNKIKTMRILILKNYKIRTQAILERLYTTYILPQIIYCSQQWNTNNPAHLRKIENELRLYWKLAKQKRTLVKS